MKFETDYIISWDISDKYFPTILIARIGAEKDKFVFDVLAMLHEKNGIVSLSDLIAEAETKNKQQ